MSLAALIRDQRAKDGRYGLYRLGKGKLKSMCVLEGLGVGLALSPAWPIEIAGTETRHETSMAQRGHQHYRGGCAHTQGEARNDQGAVKIKTGACRS